VRQTRQNPTVKFSQNLSASTASTTVLYLLLLTGISFHVYRTPIYSMDALQYMGNAALMEETDVVKVHHKVYAELDRIPRVARENLLGHQAGKSEDQNRSRLERAANPYRYAQFLPLFAIRPMYIIVLYWMSKTGLGLLRAGVVISTLSYFSLGVIFFRWLTRYLPHVSALFLALLVMMSPPIMSLGRENTADALASLVAFSGLYLIFEKQSLCRGLTLLLASLYFRTDFVVLAGPVLLALWWDRKLNLWQTSVLSALAVASVLTINHFSGDYGIRMLYYRNFVGVPYAPGEMTVSFTFRDYLRAFRSGVTLAADSFLIPFLLLGTIGAILHSRLRVVAAVATAYVVLHFIVLPNWDERWFGVFYLSMALSAVAVRPASILRRTSEQTDSAAA
jgi:hypothetical protein